MKCNYIEQVHTVYDQKAFPGKASVFTVMWVTDHGTLHIDAKDSRHSDLIAQGLEAIQASALGADVTVDPRRQEALDG